MSKPIRTSQRNSVAAGRPAKFGIKMARQVSVGIDPTRVTQLAIIQAHYQAINPISTVSESDVMRLAFDRLVASLKGEVPALRD